MKIPEIRKRSPKPMKTEPPFDRNLPSRRLKKIRKLKSDVSSRNEIEDPDRTSTKSLMNVMSAVGSQFSAHSSQKGSALRFISHIGTVNSLTAAPRSRRLSAPARSEWP